MPTPCSSESPDWTDLAQNVTLATVVQVKALENALSSHNQELVNRETMVQNMGILVNQAKEKLKYVRKASSFDSLWKLSLETRFESSLPCPKLKVL